VDENPVEKALDEVIASKYKVDPSFIDL